MLITPNNTYRLRYVTWSDYWQALQECDRWWKHDPCSKFSVLARDWSWCGTIRKLGDLVRKDWSDLAESDQKRLLGLQQDGEEEWALLGRMRPPALRAVFGNDGNRARIENAVKWVSDASADDFPRVAMDAYQEIQARNIRIGVATRLLTLARPDRLVSLNKASAKGLATFAHVSSASLLEQAENYVELLSRIYDTQWFRATEPPVHHPLEREVWSMRVALLDSFVYRRSVPKFHPD